jgi:hypothetical protein
MPYLLSSLEALCWLIDLSESLFWTALHMCDVCSVVHIPFEVYACSSPTLLEGERAYWGHGGV